MNRRARLPTITEEDELPSTLLFTSPEGDQYRVAVDPHPNGEVYSVAVIAPSGAANVEGWVDEDGVHKAIQWWSTLVARGGALLRSLFEADDFDD